MKKVMAAVISLAGLSGCAAAITAWKNDPIQAYTAKENTIHTMTGDRRTAIYMDKKFCAESMPDAVAVFAASSRAKAERDKTGLEFSDATSSGVVQTFQRTEIAEVLRQLGWNTCLAWMQGAITGPQYHALLQKMVDGSVNVMDKRASQELKSMTMYQATVGGTLPVPSPSPSPSAMPTATPSPKPSATPTAAPTPAAS